MAWIEHKEACLLPLFAGNFTEIQKLQTGFSCHNKIVFKFFTGSFWKLWVVLQLTHYNPQSQKVIKSKCLLIYFWYSFCPRKLVAVGGGGGGLNWEIEEGKAIVGGVNELVGCLAFYWWKKDHDCLFIRFFVKTELKLFIVEFEKQIFEYGF